MRNVFYGLAISALLFNACKEDKEEPAPNPTPDPEAGEVGVIFEGIHESNLLVGQESIAVSLEEDLIPAKVELYLGNEMLGTDSEAPFEFAINSREYNDGDYQLKAIAYDEKEITYEGEKSVKVSNILVEVPAIPMSSEAIYDTTHIVLAKKTGEILQKFAIGTSEPLTIYAKDDYYDESFALYYIKDSEKNYGKSQYGVANLGVKRGHSVHMPNPGEPLLNSGSITLTIKNSIEGALGIVSMHNTDYAFASTGTTTISYDLYSGEDGLVVYHLNNATEEIATYSLENVTPGETYEIDLNNFSSDAIEVTLNLPENNDNEIGAYLRLKEDDYRLYRILPPQLITGNTYSYPVIPGALKQYVDVYYRLPDNNGFNQKGGVLAELEENFTLQPLLGESIITEDNEGFTYKNNVNSAYDVFSMTFNDSNSDFYLVVNSGGEEGEFRLIDFQQLNAGLPSTSSLYFYGYGFMEVPSLNGYSDYLETEFAYMADGEPEEAYTTLYASKIQ